MLLMSLALQVTLTPSLTSPLSPWSPGSLRCSAVQQGLAAVSSVPAALLQVGQG